MLPVHLWQETCDLYIDMNLEKHSATKMYSSAELRLAVDMPF